MKKDSKKLYEPRHILLPEKTFPKKSLGQNFIIDLEVLDRISVIARLSKTDEVLEIGAGLGTLTTYLAERTKSVIAIEKDKMLFEELRESTHHLPNLELVLGDVLKINFREFFKGRKIKVVSNLPYNISSPILIKLLEHRDIFSLLVLMIQREVGERITAKPGGRVYGSISVLLQTFFHISIELHVRPESFWPKPKVDSVVLKLVPLTSPKIKLSDERLFRKIIRAAFSSRRKMLANSLCSILTKDKVEEILKASGIDRRRRAETLSVEEFGRLTEEAFKIGEKA
ncbi:MAG: ribosomal RNA small subunit methyltransferase A [Deltaproteobacteria bacterium]|nr:ribosomal RNA small subunit methyltransferase A [Deltaproteobacteria bacterium]